MFIGLGKELVGGSLKLDALLLQRHRLFLLLGERAYSADDDDYHNDDEDRDSGEYDVFERRHAPTLARAPLRTRGSDRQSLLRRVRAAKAEPKR